MDDSYNRRLHPGSLDDDTDIAPGTSLCATHTTPLRPTPWCRCMVDVLPSDARCSTRNNVRPLLGLLPTEYRVWPGTPNHRSVVSPLLTAGTRSETFAQSR